MALTFSSGRQKIKTTVIVLGSLLSITLAITGWYGLKWYTTGEMPPAVALKAMQADPRVNETPVTKKQIDEHKVPAKQPRYVSIPMLGVYRARIFSAGVDANNMLKSPANIDDVTWFDQSMKPGSGYGAVLLDGHNGGVSRNGIFANLNRLKVGDKIEIERGDGKKYSYEVRENKSMPLEEVNKTGMQMMMQSADENKEGLNIITCDGKWVPRYQQFDRRIMLRAVIVDEKK